MQRPGPEEFPPYFARYVALVTEHDVLSALRGQVDVVKQFAAQVPKEQELHAYAPGKWTIRQVMGHLADVERVFGYRVLRFSRADDTPLPGFDENTYVDHATFDDLSLGDLVEDLVLVRAANVRLLAALREPQWSQSGIANGTHVTVKAMAYMMAGHVRHHLNVLHERYGV